jgi:hypothetical protein
MVSFLNNYRSLSQTEIQCHVVALESRFHSIGRETTCGIVAGDSTLWNQGDPRFPQAKCLGHDDADFQARDRQFDPQTRSENLLLKRTGGQATQLPRRR